VITDITERKQAEDQLRRLSRVVEQSPSIVVITDTRGYIEYVNPKFTEITGYATEEALGKNPRILKSGEQGLEFYRDLWTTILAGQEWRGEFVNRKKNGKFYWELAIIAPIRNADGEITHFAKLAEDITERVRAEAELRESEERYRRLLELSFDGIGIHSEGRVEFINSTGAKLLGADNPEQLIGKPIMDFVHPDYRETVQRRQMRIKEMRAVPLIEELFIRLDGSHLNVEVTAIAADYQGKPATQVVFRDISERKRSERALRAAKDAAEAARREEEERRQEAEQRRRIAESLAAVLAALNSEQPLDEVLDLIAIQTRQLLKTEAVAIFSHNAGGEAPTIRAAQGLSAGYILEAGLPLGYDALRQAVGSHRPVAIPDVAAIVGKEDETEHPAIPPFWAERYRAWLAVPIIVRDAVNWAMLLYYAEPRAFSDDEVELAVLFSNQVALAVENNRLRAKSEEAARAAERNRLARELHDAVTQVLFSASLIAETMPRIWEREPEKGQRGLEELRRLIQGALAEMRTMLLELRPAALKEQRLDTLIRQLADGLMARTRMPVTTTVVGDCWLPPEVKLALYRITQEALNNVVKHAQASQAKVYLDCQPGQVILCVSDDGRGFASEGIEPHKLGVGIMRERAKAIGARFTLESQRDRGTEITVTWGDTE
jgi:PAS domain S-box-containing protein